MNDIDDIVIDNTDDNGNSYIPLATEILCELKRQNCRFFKVIIALILVIIIIVGAFMWELSSWDYASYDVISNDGGNANFIGNNGDINNGISESEN
jgi:uncharacterized membrane protein YjdF